MALTFTSLSHAHLILAFLIGLSLGIGLAFYVVCSYRRWLQQLGKECGYERIGRKWYRITECTESTIYLMDDMGLPQRFRQQR